MRYLSVKKAVRFSTTDFAGFSRQSVRFVNGRRADNETVHRSASFFRPPFRAITCAVQRPCVGRRVSFQVCKRAHVGGAASWVIPAARVRENDGLFFGRNDESSARRTGGIGASHRPGRTVAKNHRPCSSGQTAVPGSSAVRGRRPVTPPTRPPDGLVKNG